MTTINKNSIFAAFETDPNLERTGIRVDYGVMYFQVARAGGANDRFRDVLRAKMEPHRRAIATDTMPEKLADRLAIEAFAETVVLGWGRPAKVAEGEEPRDDDGVITWRDGSDRRFDVEAVKELFTLLPDLGKDVMEQATNRALFRRSLAELDAGN